MTWRTIRGRRVRIRSEHDRHLYSNRKDRAYERREFTERYGPTKGRYVYGSVVGKQARAREAKKRRRR